MNTTHETPFTPEWSRRVAGVTGFSGGARAPFTLAFGSPDPALFPAQAIAAATDRVLSDPRRVAVALQYGNIQGQPELIALVTEKMEREEGIHLTAQNVVITNGSLAAIGLAARALIDEGDMVLVEAPTFMGTINVLRRAGGELINLPMGPEGIDVATTEELLESLRLRGVHPKVLYTIPTFQNPSGLTIPQSARVALLEVARRYNLVIIEDDAYRELYYDAASGPLPTSLYALDYGGRVIRTGTLSKILSPGMRLGWAIAQPEIIQRMLLLKEEGGTSSFSQHVAAEYARDGALTRHIALLVDAYRAKRDAALEGLDRHFPSTVQWTRPSGGFFMWVKLPAGVDPQRLADLARQEGVDFIPGERCFAQPPNVPGTYLRLSYSLLSPVEIDEAIKRLGRVIKTLC